MAGTRRLAELSLLLLAFLVGASLAEEVVFQQLEEEVEREEACPDGGSADDTTSCSLSLRQLRAIPSSSSGAAKADQEVPPAEDEPANETQAIPSASSSSSSDAAKADQEAPPAEDEPSNKTQEADTSAAGAVPGDLAGGVPGGWGEAADFSDSFSGGLHHGNSTSEEEPPVNATLQASYRYGSCRQYGCITYFAPWLGCQCNQGCEQHGSCCGDYWSRCYSRYHHAHHHHYSPAPSKGSKILTLFHQTSPEAAELIVQNGFRPGTQGWCGGGIYFATSAEATQTKAIGPDSHKGQMLQAQVNVGKVKYMPKQCDRGLTGHEVAREGYDSVSFNPGDGQEYIVYSADHVISVKKI